MSSCIPAMPSIPVPSTEKEAGFPVGTTETEAARAGDVNNRNMNKERTM
jgi:hypothetical protein